MDLRQLLADRVAVLDGAWGTMLQGAEVSPPPTTATSALRGRPRPAQPDPARRDPRRPPAVPRGRAPTSPRPTRFTATTIGQADYGAEHAVREHEPRRARGSPGRRPTRSAGGSSPARSARSNVTLSLSPKVDDPAYRAVTFDQVKAAYAEQIARARRGRRRPAADRDDLRHAQREGGDRRRPRGRAGPAAVDLGHDRRPERAHPLRPDRRGVLALDRASPSRWSSASTARSARPRCGRTSPSLAKHRGHVRRLPPQRRACPTRSAATTRRPTRPARCSASSPAQGIVNIVGGCCGTHPGAHRRDRRGA